MSGFPHETLVIKREFENDFNIQVVRIKRDIGICDEDVSECALDYMRDDDFDLVVENDGSVGELWEKCTNIFES